MNSKRGQLCFLICLTLFDGQFGANWKTPGKDLTKTLDALLKDYDKRVRPDFGVSPVNVVVDLYLIRVEKLSDKNMELSVEFYFRQSWVDNRLLFKVPFAESIVVGAEVAEKFWQPDTFIPEGTADFKATQFVFWRLTGDGFVKKSVMVRAKTFCPLDLAYYPHDTQMCAIDFESYGYGMQDIIYNWSPDLNPNTTYGYNFELPNFKTLAFRIHTKETFLVTGNYSRLIAEFIFERISHYHIRHYYAPAILFYVLSWCSFWIPPSSGSFRGMVHLTSILMTTLLLYATGNQLPQLGYSTRLEIYLMACLGMNVFAFLTFLVSGCIQEKSRNNSRDVTREDNVEKGKFIMETEAKRKISVVYCSCRPFTSFRFRFWPGHYLSLDFLSCLLYPTVFVVFNLWYWFSLPSN